MTDQAFELNGEHPADRVMRSQAISSDIYLRGDPPPTPNQVAAVMHALADFTHNQHMVGPAVVHLGQDRETHGEAWVRATALGRYFHRLGDHLDTGEPGESTLRVARDQITIDRLRSQAEAVENAVSEMPVDTIVYEVVSNTVGEESYRSSAGWALHLFEIIVDENPGVADPESPLRDMMDEETYRRRFRSRPMTMDELRELAAATKRKRRREQIRHAFVEHHSGDAPLSAAEFEALAVEDYELDVERFARDREVFERVRASFAQTTQ